MNFRIATLATAAAVAALAANGIYGAVKGSDTRSVPDDATAAAIQAGYGQSTTPPQLAAQIAAHTRSYAYASPEILNLGYGPSGPR